MKSKLLATSALVAAGLWGMADVAQAQKVAPITAVVGGYHEQTFGYASNEDGARLGQRPGASPSHCVVRV